MKKSLLLTLSSLFILQGCGDDREKHIFTVEAEITDLKGKIQKVRQDCAQLQPRCAASFKVECPSGVEDFKVCVANDPAHPEKVVPQLMSASSSEAGERITDTEYQQRGWIESNMPRFKQIRLESSSWKPRTERVLETDLLIPYPDIKKYHQEREELHKKFLRARTHEESMKYSRERDQKLKEMKNLPPVKVASLKVRIY